MATYSSTHVSRPATLPRITPYGDPASGSAAEQLVPVDMDERLVYAQRLVAHQCLYGVDKNPLAVEMAKLSLWLLTLAKDKPFTFLDHAIRSGDSLVGTTNLQQLETFSLDGTSEVISALLHPIKNKIQLALKYRNELEQAPSNTIEEVEYQQRKHAAADEQAGRLRFVADLLICADWKTGSAREREEARPPKLYDALQHFADASLPELEERSGKYRSEAGIKETFHWPLEFPEVFANDGGFDALVCNPPFMGAKKITGSFSTPYREYIVEHLAAGERGNADLCAYFFLRAGSLLQRNGHFGFLATNTISQGDTREVALDAPIRNGCSISRAIPSKKWPGNATVEVSAVWMRKSGWSRPFYLDDRKVGGITSFLRDSDEIVGSPFCLAANNSRCFQGSNILGMGFTLLLENAKALCRKNSRNREVLFPFVNGQELNSSPDQSGSRWIINFFDWPLDRKSAPDGYTGPVAADYPDCLSIVTEFVKPEREKLGLKKDSSAQGYARWWWQYARKGVELYRTISKLNRVLAIARTSKTQSPVFVKNGQVFSDSMVVFALSDAHSFVVLASSFHYFWVMQYGASLRTDAVYKPADCFDTFPFPNTRLDHLDMIGESYHEYRHRLMLSRNEGLTATYNLVHDPDESAPEIQKLRELHVDTDKAVAAAYGWDDLSLGHGFRETKQGGRFTISESAKREVLARLLKLNHERYAEETAQGLHANGGVGKKGKKTRVAATAGNLFHQEG